MHTPLHALCLFRGPVHALDSAAVKADVSHLGGTGQPVFTTDHEASLELFQWREFDYDDMADQDKLIDDLLLAASEQAPEAGNSSLMFRAPPQEHQPSLTEQKHTPTTDESTQRGTGPIFLDNRGRMQMAETGSDHQKREWSRGAPSRAHWIHAARTGPSVCRAVISPDGVSPYPREDDAYFCTLPLVHLYLFVFTLQT